MHHHLYAHCWHYECHRCGLISVVPSCILCDARDTWKMEMGTFCIIMGWCQDFMLQWYMHSPGKEYSNFIYLHVRHTTGHDAAYLHIMLKHYNISYLDIKCNQYICNNYYDIADQNGLSPPTENVSSNRPKSAMGWGGRKGWAVYQSSYQQYTCQMWKQ